MRDDRPAPREIIEASIVVMGMSNLGLCAETHDDPNVFRTRVGVDRFVAGAPRGDRAG